MPQLDTDVLVIGAGGAGMYAAVAAAREGARVVLADKSLVGRGGATIMAQMTVAAAVGEWQPDHWTHHFADTVEAGRGLCNERLAAILCEEAPRRIREMDSWRVGWAREDGRMRAVMAPGHRIPRCVYVDFLNTGPAVAKTLRGRVAQGAGIARVSGLPIAELVVHDRRVAGAVGINLEDGRPVGISASAVILAAGGLTRLFRRNSASANMGGDAYALALDAGAELIDMEFPQFFPIGHLAPRLVGMDPIMWDPFRYKLGGRLLNGRMEEFIETYGESDSGVYTAPRDITSYAIVKECEAGRGSPGGGAYLSFEHIPEPELRLAFGPVIDRLAKNGIDLTKRPIEVAPIAHYHMGGIRVDERMETRVEGLYAAGEAVGGANGANRLSGNAIPEAFVFGERAGRFAAERKGEARAWRSGDDARAPALVEIAHGGGGQAAGLGALLRELQALMWDDVGLLRTENGLSRALGRIREMREQDLPALAPARKAHFDPALLDWLDLRSSLAAAESVALAALNRKESRGAHQREDFVETDPAYARNQVLRLSGDGALEGGWTGIVAEPHARAPLEAAE
ncbi:MAG: FAD-binding protein [Defluviicoccus sp.]|nr:FAD-binding protein [Defluviicoccus sp.]MDE0383134.1 FAD-binding protein [Defluviicoccus sp.]